MTDNRLSSQAGPVDIMYELDDSILRPPIPPKHPHDHEPETDTGTQSSMNGYEGQQQQVGNNINRSPSGYAPQITEVKTTVPPTIPESTVSSLSPVSPHPSMMYGASQDTNFPSDSYSQHYQLTQSGDSNFSPTNYAGSEASYAAPQYSTPISGYYAPVQYNPEQSYGIQQGPYPPQSPPQSPPPTKPEFSLYGSQVPPPAVPPSAGPPPPPPPPPVAATPDGEQRMKKRMCGMTVTVFSLLCVALFVVIAGAVLGGVFGSGVLKKEKNSSENNSNDPTSIEFPTSFPNIIITEPIPEPTSTDSNESITTPATATTTPTSTVSSTINTFAYPIPSGTWTLSAPLQMNTGSCINNPSDTNYKEVTYCPDNKTYTIVIKDFSSVDKYMYLLDMDIPVRRRGIQGLAPNGPDPDKGDRPFWQFEVPYMGQAFEQTDCEVRMSLIFLLGRTKNIFAFAEGSYAPDSCILPHGGNSTAGVSCTCIYLNGGET